MCARTCQIQVISLISYDPETPTQFELQVVLVLPLFVCVFRQTQQQTHPLLKRTDRTEQLVPDIDSQVALSMYPTIHIQPVNTHINLARSTQLYHREKQLPTP
jgi:hypothetical protein